ncbi:MAG: nitronate monooxygenase [Candidatus Berkelbacteria bacterium]|nr:nitronate monooxygenase [Candidatus Berkelbacteria bacterium]
MTKLNRLINTQILQGGMGVGVSFWKLPRAVALRGQAGTVSGTGAALVVPRLLQEGDKDGSIARAKAAFPIPELAQMVWDRYYHEDGIVQNKQYKSIPMPDHEPKELKRALLIFSSFAAVYLAKEGHKGLIGINLLEKLQAPHLYEALGAMLADVDFFAVGAGIGDQFPKMIDDFYRLEVASYNIDVKSGDGYDPGTYEMTFDPKTVISRQDFQRLGIEKPPCLFIVSTPLAAKAILRGMKGVLPDGFVVEGDRAGGHNARPRGDFPLNDRGEPVYNLEKKDNPDYEYFRDLGLPFWIAGESCSPEALQRALDLGACGVQIGTAFSFSRESGILLEIKQRSVRDGLDGKYDVYTSLTASPTGYPFKMVMRKGTLWELKVYEDRIRICDIGYLREAFWKKDKNGNKTIGWRCSSEPIEDYLGKGGQIEKTVGSVCVCNGLMATIGLGQYRKNEGRREPQLITSGDDIRFLQHLQDKLGPDGLYGAGDVIDYVLGLAA